MRRNAAGQKIQAMMRTASPFIGAIVPVATTAINSYTNQSPCLVTANGHGAVPGNIVTITGSGTTGGSIDGTYVCGANASMSVNVIALFNPNTGAAITGVTGTGGTLTVYSVAVYVTKDGGVPTLGTGTLTHVGRGNLGQTYAATKHQVVSPAAQSTATLAFVGNNVHHSTAFSPAYSTVQSTTLGLWVYSPTAAETNAQTVSFTFTSPATQATLGGANTAPTAGAVTVTQTFEPTFGPIMLQTTVSGTPANQTTIVLAAGSGDSGAYNDATVVFEDHTDATTVGKKGVASVKSYNGSTKTLTTYGTIDGYTIAANNLVTIIASPTLPPIYLAKLGFEQNSGTDKYRLKWYKNATPQDSGVTSCNIRVIAESGSDLVVSTAMTDAGSNDWKYTEATNVVANGVTVRVRVTATIDGATRTQDFIVTGEA